MKGAVDLAGFYRRIGDTLKKHCRGSTAWVFTEHGPNAKAIGLRSSRSIPLFNGKIECRLLEFRMY
jgi:putative N6-adenine-specific DNA methylase